MGHFEKLLPGDSLPVESSSEWYLEHFSKRVSCIYLSICDHLRKRNPNYLLKEELEPG